MKTAEEFMTFGQGNIEALVQSGQIVATGLQDLGKQIAADAQASLEETLSAYRALTNVGSLREAFDLQSSLARSTIEKAMAQSGKVAETSFKLAEQAIAPLANRVTYAVETFGKAG